METNRLRQFRVVVETGNLRQAAGLLGLSHSGLSKSMRALQDELGFELFRPLGRGIVVTDEGRGFYDRSAPFLAELDKLLGQAKDKPKDVLRLGSFEVFTSFFMGPLVAGYLPDAEVEVHELTPGRLEEALLLGKVDVGVTYEPIPRAGIEYVKVTQLVMGAYVRKGSFRGVDLAQIPFVTPVQPLEGTPSGVRGRDGWPDERIPRDARYRVDLMTTGLELARQGLCAIFIPRFVAHLHNERAAADSKLEAVPLPKSLANVKRDVFVVKRESSDETPAFRRIAAALRKVCAEG
jgi:DNA-binding transcriptional LysR family regulator